MKNASWSEAVAAWWHIKTNQLCPSQQHTSYHMLHFSCWQTLRYSRSKAGCVYCNECVCMILKNYCHHTVIQRPPSTGEEFSIMLSVHRFCLDKAVFSNDVLLWKCHFNRNQRWIHNTETLQVISVKSPSHCWDIDGKVKHFGFVSISWMLMPSWYCGSVCGQIISNYGIDYIGILFPCLL